MRFAAALLLLCGCLRTVTIGRQDGGRHEVDDGGDEVTDAGTCGLDSCPACALACARTVECLADGGAVCGCACARTVKLPGGTFLMGGQAGQSVTVPAFEMLRTEVTWADYERCRTTGVVPCLALTCTGQPSEPVTCVDFTAASIYCASEGMQLPTEAQWEYAARLDAGEYPWGDAPPDCDRALFADCGFTRPEPAGAHQLGATPAGILGLADNVREWTSSDFGAGTKSIRGGAYDSAPTALRSVAREPQSALGSSPNIGFRCVK